MAGRQETITDYFQLAKEIAKVEKELGIEQWDFVVIERDGDREGDHIKLYTYDLPRHIAEKYEWVIRWRAARLQCQFPRYTVRYCHSPYRKVMGENIGMQNDINVFVAAKAQVSRQKRALQEYITFRRANDMFFDEANDDSVIKAKAKLAQKQEAVQKAEARMIEKVKQYKNQSDGKAKKQRTG